MTSGGPRNRSGPQKDPNSERSIGSNFSLTALPARYDGVIPDFPLPHPSERELELWRERWCGPHGAAWSHSSNSWLAWDVGLWVRTAVRCEDEGAPAGLISNLHRLGDRVGLSAAGLAEMGWMIPADEVAERRSAKESAKPTGGSRGRVKVVKADGG